MTKLAPHRLPLLAIMKGVPLNPLNMPDNYTASTLTFYQKTSSSDQHIGVALHCLFPS